MTDVLFVIDMQNDFIDGALGTKEAEKIVKPVVNLIKLLNNAQSEHDVKLKVVATRDTHDDATYMDSMEGKNLPVKHCIRDSHGWQIRTEVADALDEAKAIIIDKPNFGLKPEMMKNLFDNVITDKINKIYVCGLCTDICVLSNVMLLKSLYPEADIIVIENCCAGVTPAKHDAAIESMRSCQISIKEFARKDKYDNAYWTVNSLIAKLQQIKESGNGDKLIVVAEDEEGNGYRPLLRQDILVTRDEVEEYVEEDDLNVDIDDVIVI